MRTTTRVHSPEERLIMRQESEKRTRRSAIRLLCCVSALRTLWTRVIPLAGSASWWLAVLCLLPGITLLLVALLAMRLTGTRTLTDCARRCLGSVGGLMMSMVMSILLLWEGLSSMTALITMFTQGIGTRGTQITMAVLTSAALILCLHREGLARAVWLIWPVITGAAVLIAAVLLPSMHTDGLFPVQGDGPAAINAALWAGAGAGWPFLLLLTIPDDGPSHHAGRMIPAIPAVLLPVLLQVLVIPHELLIRRHDLAGTLLHLTLHAPTAVQTLHRCLLMLILFLTAGISILLLTEQFSAPFGREPRWLPIMILLLVTAAQTLNAGVLWQFLGKAGPWLLMPAAALIATFILLSLIRRKPV